MRPSLAAGGDDVIMRLYRTYTPVPLDFDITRFYCMLYVKCGKINNLAVSNFVIIEKLTS